VSPFRRKRRETAILRHTEERPATPATEDWELVEAVSAHAERHIGPVESVYHQLVSPWIYVDVHAIAPSEDRPWRTLVTSGMAQRPMSDGRFAELVMVVAPHWPVPDTPGFDETARWPFRLLQDLAELPHRFGTTLGTGHTVPNGDPPAPYAPGTALCGVLLFPPVLQPDGFDTLTWAGARSTSSPCSPSTRRRWTSSSPGASSR
jgi:Suppressor of fused protein (SUFU)